MNITQNARRVVFCGTFTTSGLTTRVSDGKLEILHEGQVQKFIEQVDQISFLGDQAREQKQEVLFITERAMFALRKNWSAYDTA